MMRRGSGRTRMTVHISFAVLFLLCILVFKWVNNKSIINIILELAGYTYGPLLGLFSFGIFTRRVLPNTWKITALCLLSPVCCFFLSKYSAQWFGGFQIGLELLLINGVLTLFGFVGRCRDRRKRSIDLYLHQIFLAMELIDPKAQAYAEKYSSKPGEFIAGDRRLYGGQSSGGADA